MFYYSSGITTFYRLCRLPLASTDFNHIQYGKIAYVSFRTNAVASFTEPIFFVPIQTYVVFRV